MADVVHKRVLAFRHPNTNKAEPGSGFKGDLARTVSPKGILQGQMRRQLLGNSEFDRIGSSFAGRAQDGARLISGKPASFQPTIINGIGVTDPAEGGDAYVIDELFNGLGYAALATYREKPENRAVMDRYGETGWNDLKDFIWEDRHHDERLLVVGHAVLLPQAFLPSLESRPDFAKQLLELSLEEVGGFRIIYHNEVPFELTIFNETLPESLAIARHG